MSLHPLRLRPQAPAAGPRVHVAVTDPAVLGTAHRMAGALVAEAAYRVDLDRPDAEVYRILHAGGREVTVSPLLAHLVEVALQASQDTGGLLDPTVGPAVLALDADGAHRGARSGALPACGSAAPVRHRPAVGAEAVRIRGRRVCAPAGVLLDLRATTDAVVAAAASRSIATRLNTGVLVVVGSDAAQAGPPPVAGWQLPQPDGRSRLLPAGLAMSTVRPSSGRLVDPRTGRPVPSDRADVTVLHTDPVTAKARAVAAAVLGELPDLRIPAPRTRRAS